jgi:hypothetical protein
MSETEADREFYAAAESAFIRRRGTPFLLSPRDFALLKEWRGLGVPIEAIEQGIDEAFSRRQERGATGRINSLSYCRDAVLLAWERRAETSLGRGAGRTTPEPEIGATLSALEERLGELASRRPELSPALESARRAVGRLGSSGKAAGEIEVSLARLDKKLAGALLETLPDTDRLAISEEASARLAAARAKMDDVAALRTLHALERRLLRERLDLPRLTLL